MNSIINKGVVTLNNMIFYDIEGGFGTNKKAMLVKDIASIHHRELKDINRNINNNIKRFKNGVDIIDLKVGDFKSLSLELGYSNQAYANANNIYILSERGYSKLLKILEDDVAWDIYEILVDEYFNNKKQLSDLNNLSPQLQLLINIELEQKNLRKEISDTKIATIAIGQKIDNMRNAIAITPKTSWRKTTNSIINNVCKAANDYHTPKENIYKALETRAKCKLNVRLRNMQARMALNGVCQSKINQLNKLDVIEEDPKLTEIYLAIIKEIAVKYNIPVKENDLCS